MVVPSDKTSGPVINLLQIVYVTFEEGIPNRRGIVRCWSYKGYVRSLFELGRTWRDQLRSSEVSTPRYLASSTTRTKFQLEILTKNLISGIVYFARLFRRACETLVKQPPEFWATPTFRKCVKLKPGLNTQWLATIRQATHSSLHRRREVIRLGDGKSDRWSQHCRFRLFSPSIRNNNSPNSYKSKNITFSSDYHLLLVSALQ